MTLTNPGIPTRKTVVSLSPWFMFGLAAILVAAVSALAVRNTHRERFHMSQSLMDKAAAMIWGLESGARAWIGMSGIGQHLQLLLQETAKQSGITYIAVTDENGVTLAHSDVSKVGQRLHDIKTIAAIKIDDVQKWRLVRTSKASKVFEVYKNFSPLPDLRDDSWHIPPDACDDCGPGTPSGKKRILGKDRLAIFVGLDVKPFEDALAEDFRTTILLSVLVGLLAMAGFFSLFWAANYRLSRQLLQDARAFASEIVSNLPVGLVAINSGGIVTSANSVATSMLGVNAESLVGSELCTRDGLNWAGIMDELSQREKVLEQELCLKTSSGRDIPICLSATRITNQEGIFLGHLFIMRDLREVKDLQDLARRNERLSALGNLAAGVAHEIRNPLSSIKGFATYLAKKLANTKAEKETADMIIQEVNRLNRVVSELLEFARPREMPLVDGNVNDAVERALRLSRSDAMVKGIVTRFVRDDTLPLVLLDTERFTQALLNLFLNAIQATDPGGSLDVRAEIGEEINMLSIRIADTGKGMNAQTLSGIFNPYFTTKPTGTGLGLAIVHRIVEGHGGEIKVESKPGKGTIFTILLPLKNQAAGTHHG